MSPRALHSQARDAPTLWRHTFQFSKFVTVIIDLTPIRDGSGPSRLLDMVPARSKKVFKDRLEQQTAEFPDGLEMVATNGFSGYSQIHGFTRDVDFAPSA